MKLSRLEKVHEGFTRLKELDKEILEIEKLANDIASKRVELELNLKCVRPEEKKEDILDSDGSLKSSARSNTWMSYYTFSTEPKKPPQNESTYKEYIQDTLALQLLGVMILNKQEQRNFILKTFEKWGIEI